ncbi:MAG: YetF domain-containing protein [Chitinophagales bacterium]
MTFLHLVDASDHLPLWGFAIRAVLVYLGLIFCTRLTGRREVAALDPFSLVLALTVGSLGSPPLANSRASLFSALVAIAVFYSVHLVFFFLEKASPVFAKLVGDEPLVVVENGKVVEDNLLKAHYNMDNLLAQLRLKGFLHLSDVEFAVVEPSGEFSVVPKAQARPATPADLGLKPPERGWPVTIVHDGRLNQENLAQSGHDEQWVLSTLRSKGIERLEDVMYMSVDDQENVYVDFIRPSRWQYLK